VIASTQTYFSLGSSTAYQVYDGAGRVFDTHFHGFYPTTMSFLGDTGAAGRHTWHRFSGLSFNAGAPRIVLPDYASATPNYDQVHDLQEPRRWGIALRDEDGTFGGTANTTIISNHPMMRSNGDTAPYANWANTYVSTRSFAHLRILHPGLLSTGSPYVDLPAITLTRNLSGHAPVVFLNDYKTDGHKQFPVIVNTAPATTSSYIANWEVLPGPEPDDRDVRVTLDDLAELPIGTHVTIICDVADGQPAGFGNQASLSVVHDGTGVPLQQYPTRTALLNGTVTGYWVDTAAPTPKPVWLRFVKPAGTMRQVVKMTW
jgi:hypothetical protein